MRQYTLFLSACVALTSTQAATSATADEYPEIEYGLWETTTVTSIKSETMNLPGNTNTTSDCVTEEDVKEGMAFMDDMENCEILEKELTKTSADISMVCNQPQTGEMRMTVSMKYDGDTMSGEMNGEMDSPMGPMSMLVEMDGRRTGSC